MMPMASVYTVVTDRLTIENLLGTFGPSPILWASQSVIPFAWEVTNPAAGKASKRPRLLPSNLTNLLLPKSMQDPSGH